MPGAAGPAAIAVSRAVDAVMRADRGRLLAALIARLGSFQRAEDALQEAAVAALAHWGRTGMPASPQGWLLRVALRKAIDGLRREARAGSHAAERMLLDEVAVDAEVEVIPDHRLRLIFTCCHPALEEKTRVALTLRTLCGLSTGTIARVFLDHEATMGQRLSRAKAKIAAARIPFAVPDAPDLPGRLGSVLTVIYLVFTAGYTAGPVEGRDLCDEAVFLARMVAGMDPIAPEPAGCLALLLLLQGRRAARLGADGATVPPAEQDKALWDHAMLDEGRARLEAALGQGRPGPFQIKAAIAACHAQQPADWPQIAALHGALLTHEDTPVIRLNHAVALAEAVGGAAGAGRALSVLARLAPALDGFQPFHAARAEFRLRADDAAALADFDRAITLAVHAADRVFLERRRDLALQRFCMG